MRSHEALIAVVADKIAVVGGDTAKVLFELVRRFFVGPTLLEGLATGGALVGL